MFFIGVELQRWLSSYLDIQSNQFKAFSSCTLEAPPATWQKPESLGLQGAELLSSIRKIKEVREERTHRDRGYRGFLPENLKHGGTEF